MCYPKIILLSCFSFFLFTPVFLVRVTGDDKQTKGVDIELERYLHGLDKDNEQSIDVSEPTKEQLDFERRRIIASKYLDTLESVKRDWIDPYDMGGGRLTTFFEQKKSKTNSPEVLSDPSSISKMDDSSLNVKKEELSTSSNSKVLSALKEQQCVLDNVYITRWLKKLLLRIEKETGIEYSTISFPLDSDTIDNLKQMSSAKTFEVAMLDEVLSKMLAQADIKQKESYFAAAYTYHIDILKGIAVASGIMLFVYTLRRSFLRRPKLTILGCALVINIGWHWMHLYQKIKAHKHAELSSMQIPSQCKKHDLGLFEHMAEYFKSFFTTSECNKYYEALLVDPFWEVSFSVAATEAATATLFQPLFASSRALNYFLKQLFEGLPIYLTVFLIMFIFFVTLMKFGYAIRLPLFMGRIEPCRPVAGSRVEELERPTQLPKLTDAVLNAVTDTVVISEKQILKEDSSMDTRFTETSEESSQAFNHPRNEDGTQKGRYRTAGELMHYPLTEIVKQMTAEEELKRFNEAAKLFPPRRYDENDKDDTGKCVNRQDSETPSYCIPEVPDKAISEEGLAVRSGSFEVLSDGEGSNLIQRTSSKTEVNESIKIGSHISDLAVSVTSSNTPTTLAVLETVAEPNVYASSAQVEDVADSHWYPDSPIPAGRNTCLTLVSDLLSKRMTDSFEIIDRVEEAPFHPSRIAGPHCDTSQDILREMHRGCKFCNSTDSIE